MMNGYSKISDIKCRKARSIDFADVFSFPQSPRDVKKISQNPSTSKPQEEEDQRDQKNPQIKENKTDLQVAASSEQDEHESGTGDRVDSSAALGRSGSVSSVSGFPSSLKRAFSIRRSSSVSERYCRIHDQYLVVSSPSNDDYKGVHAVMERTRSRKIKHRGAKIFRACKRLFGF